MELNILLQSTQDVVNILSIKEVSIIGILLLIIVYLVWQQNKTEKKHDQEKIEFKEMINDARTKQDEEYQRSNEDIKNIVAKYYAISTKVLETLNNKL